MYNILVTSFDRPSLGEQKSGLSKQVASQKRLINMLKIDLGDQVSGLSMTVDSTFACGQRSSSYQGYPQEPKVISSY